MMSTRFFNFKEYAFKGEKQKFTSLPSIPKKSKKNNEIIDSAQNRVQAECECFGENDTNATECERSEILLQSDVNSHDLVRNHSGDSKLNQKNSLNLCGNGNEDDFSVIRSNTNLNPSNIRGIYGQRMIYRDFIEAQSTNCEEIYSGSLNGELKLKLSCDDGSLKDSILSDFQHSKDSDERRKSDRNSCLRISKKRRLKKCKVVDSEDHSVDFEEKGSPQYDQYDTEKEDDAKATRALVECLEISEDMKRNLVKSLGGENLDHQREIGEKIANGRCHIYESFNLPSVLSDQSKPTILKLKDYQKAGIHWLMTQHENDRNGILADEMGLGKSAQTCVFLNILYENMGAKSPTIIAAPASLLDNWVSEAYFWAPALRGKVMKYHGKQAERRLLAVEFLQKLNTPEQYHVLISSVNTITTKWDEQYLKQIHSVEYLVVDEAHNLKNKDALVYKKLNKNIRSKRRLLLTGSPIQNRTEELRNLLLFVMPSIFDSDSLNFALKSYASQARCTRSHPIGDPLSINSTENTPVRDNYTRKTNIIDALEDYAESANNMGLTYEVECLQKILAPFILRRLKSEVLFDLPKKVNLVIRCTMEGRQKEMYIQEIMQKKTDLARQLDKLTSFLSESKTMLESNDKQKSELFEDKLSENTDSNSSVLSLGDKESTDKSDVQSNKNLNKKFVNSLLFRLRRICNHPLTMQGSYSEEQIQKIVDYYHMNVEGFVGNPRKKVEEEIRRWSDYEVHQACYEIEELSWAKIMSEKLLESAKIRPMLQIVNEVYAKGSKALIFSQFTMYLDIILEVLDIYCPQIRYLRLDGSTVVSERQTLVDNFNSNKNITLFLLSTRAGGQGLNLTAATTVILMDQDWNPHNDRQAEDRVHRLGQHQDVTIYRLCCRGTIEESILRVCQKKLNLDEAFGGNSELLHAAILKDSLEIHEEDKDGSSHVLSGELCKVNGVDSSLEVPQSDER